jgi:hypothetical protein
MQFGMLPILVFLVLLLPVLRRASITRDPRAAGLAVSMFLTVAGMAIGALIRGSNTVIPAHYHASIGAVTVAFMAFTYPALGLSHRRIYALQPLIYGIGQFTFAVGFGLAGAARKVYGAEQAERGLTETVGLVIMGLGGFIAVAGGVMFLFIACRALFGRQSTPQPSVCHG